LFLSRSAQEIGLSDKKRKNPKVKTIEEAVKTKSEQIKFSLKNSL